MKRFITSDWHLGDNRFKRLRREEFKDDKDMVDSLVKNHNELVEPNDLVIVVGDVQFDQAEENWLHHVERFNGNKILIRGNHDRIFEDSDFKPYFMEIFEEGSGLDIKVGDIDCWATHHPSCSRIDRFNLVGHIHDLWKIQLNMLNVGIDVHHFRPVDLDDMVPHMHKYICNYFDSDVFAAYHPVNMRYYEHRGTQKAYFNHCSDEHYNKCYDPRYCRNSV